MLKVDGKTEVVNDGWHPIGGEEYFYEMDITMILPMSAQGKPDWTQKTSRVNEYGDGPLKRLLHGTAQISEETGAALVTISETAAASAAQPTPPNPMKELAGDIARKIREAKSQPDLEALWVAADSDLLKIKAESETAFDDLSRRYRARIESLNVCTTCKGRGLIEEEADGQQWKEPCPSCSKSGGNNGVAEQDKLTNIEKGLA